MPNTNKTRSAITRPSVLEVWLNDVRVGTLTNLPYDRNLFVFDDAYLADANRPKLSLGLLDPHGNVIAEPQEVTARVPPFFSNLLPEGHLREYLAKRGGVNAVREFFLLWLLGADLPGAVRVQDAEGRALPPREAAARARAEHTGEEPLRFSLAGVQLKFSAVGDPNKQLAIPVEGRGGHWIVKLPSPRYPLVPENEFSMMALAKEVGMEIAETALVPTGEIENLPDELTNDKSNSLVVKRFDRTAEGRRIHIEDFNQIYRQFPDKKYQRFSYGNMAEDIWRVLGERGLTEFVRRLVFNAAIGNADMHLKNWSVIYPDGRTPQLSPGYDFVSTIRYIEDRTMALSIVGEKDAQHLDTELLERFAGHARVPTQMVVNTALETAEKFVRVWREKNADLPLDEEMRQRIEDRLRYVPLTRQFVPDRKSTGRSEGAVQPKKKRRR
ncbi:MAG TPA: HipA domain-containing protein [Terriglobales bacterium]|jgi:serine/threonine-protein kinase HipA